MEVKQNVTPNKAHSMYAKQTSCYRLVHATQHIGAKTAHIYPKKKKTHLGRAWSVDRRGREAPSNKVHQVTSKLRVVRDTDPGKTRDRGQAKMVEEGVEKRMANRSR